MTSSKTALANKRACMSSQVHICAMEYWQLIMTGTCANLSEINACVLFSLQQHTKNGESGWIQNPAQIINAHHRLVYYWAYSNIQQLFENMIFSVWHSDHDMNTRPKICETGHKAWIFDAILSLKTSKIWKFCLDFGLMSMIQTPSVFGFSRICMHH